MNNRRNDMRIGSENKALLRAISQGEELQPADRDYLIKLVKRDSPVKPGLYNGQVNGEWKRYIKCGICERNLRKPSPKIPVELRRFCPACGQRIDWFTLSREEGEFV